jgi:hypothetical protein
MANIRGQTRTKTERIKEETESVGTVIEWQNIENIRGQAGIKTEMIKEEIKELLEQSLNGKMWKILEATDMDKKQRGLKKRLRLLEQ